MKGELEELIRPRTLYALIFFATYAVMVSTGNNPPQELHNIVLIILGFYFGQKMPEQRN